MRPVRSASLAIVRARTVVEPAPGEATLTELHPEGGSEAGARMEDRVELSA